MLGDVIRYQDRHSSGPSDALHPSSSQGHLLGSTAALPVSKMQISPGREVCATCCPKGSVLRALCSFIW